VPHRSPRQLKGGGVLLAQVDLATSLERVQRRAARRRVGAGRLRRTTTTAAATANGEATGRRAGRRTVPVAPTVTLAGTRAGGLPGFDGSDCPPGLRSTA
jgi:hypothetical protein